MGICMNCWDDQSYAQAEADDYYRRQYDAMMQDEADAYYRAIHLDEIRNRCGEAPAPDKGDPDRVVAELHVKPREEES